MDVMVSRRSIVCKTLCTRIIMTYAVLYKRMEGEKSALSSFLLVVRFVPEFKICVDTTCPRRKVLGCQQKQSGGRDDVFGETRLGYWDRSNRRKPGTWL